MTFPQGRRSTDRQDQTQAGEGLLGRLRHAATRLTPNGLPYRRLVLLGLCSASVVVAQVGKTPEAENALFEEKEEGIPVTDDLVLAKCGSCHAPDAKGNMSRISWSRTTPEGWAMVIRRMVKLNGLEITPQESRSVIKYLSTWHGLAPEEAKPVMYIPEKRYLDETNIPNETVRTACAACHTFGQPLSWRRSKVEWKLLQNMHVALFSQADAQYNRPSTEPGDQPAPGSTPAGGTPPKPRKAGDVGYEYISKTAPLVTPQWTAWRPRIRPAKLSGTWLVSASVPGKGRFVGEMTIAPGAAEDEFTTSTTLRSLSGGPSMSRSGKGIAYAGYSWRGESKSGTPPTATPGDLASDLREAMYFSPDQTSAEGRWFWGEYQEFGYDVKLTRATGAPVIATATPDMLKAGVKGAEMRIYGHDLPATLTPADIDVGEGVKVTKVVSASPTEVVATVDVAADATSGWHDINVAGVTLEKAVPVYNNIDYLKVTPETSLSRLGGGKHPKGYTQFEAIGFENGPDGKRETADDIMVGPIAADWSVEEFMQVYYDDDTKYVGSLSSTALFTPSIDGPNPERRFGRNNYGDVWVVAKAKTEKDKLGAPLTAKSFLIVTVPSYQRRDQPELGQ